jgi:hypothetical protein
VKASLHVLGGSVPLDMARVGAGCARGFDLTRGNCPSRRDRVLSCLSVAAVARAALTNIKYHNKSHCKHSHHSTGKRD